MSHLFMTGCAIRRGPGMFVKERLDKNGVAVDAILLHNTRTQRFDANWLLESAAGKRHTMIPPMNGLDRPLRQRLVRGVTAVASGYFPVGCVLPIFKLVTHDMAVDAGSRIIRQIGGPLCKPEGKDGQSQQASHQKRSAARD